MVFFEKVALTKTFAKLTRKHLYRRNYFSKLAGPQPAHFSKKDSSTNVPVGLLQINQEHLFLRAPPGNQLHLQIPNHLKKGFVKKMFKSTSGRL